MATGDRSDNRAILLVEDDPDHAALTLRAFRRNHLRNPVVVARDGAEAVEHLFGHGRFAGADLPALVVLDLQLPKVDGREVLRRLRADARTRLVPVVILTSSAEEEDMLAGYALGANSYVRKPVDFAAFVEATRQLGLYWLLLNESPRGAGG